MVAGTPDGGPDSSVAPSVSLVAYDISGNAVSSWSIPDMSQSIGVDSSNDLFTFSWETPAPGPTSTSLVTKFDPSGHSLWAAPIVGAAVTGLAVTAVGGVATVVTTPADGTATAFAPRIVVLGPTGSLRWSRVLRGTGNVFVYTIAADTAGDVVVSGIFSNTLDVGGHEPVSGPRGDPTAQTLFLAKYDDAGGLLWSRQYGVTAAMPGEGLDAEWSSTAIAPNGDILAVGLVYNAVIGLGTTTFAARESQDSLLVRLNRDGDLVGVSEPGEPGARLMESRPMIVVGAQGQAALVGTFAGNVDFGAGLLVSHAPGPGQVPPMGPGQDAFVAAFALLGD